MKNIILILAFSVLILGCIKNNRMQIYNNEFIVKTHVNIENYINYDTQDINIISQNYENNILNSDENYVFNETCVLITDLYRFVMSWGYCNTDRPNYHRANEVTKLLVNFLKTEKSWSIDIKKELPFIYSVSKSKDDMVRTYSWEYDRGTAEGFHNIIQYRMKSGVINAVYVTPSYHNYEDFLYSQLGFIHGPAYEIGCELGEQIYLFYTESSRGGSTVYFSFLAVKFTNEIIEPYMVFNGNNKINFSTIIGYIDIETHFNEMPFLIQINFFLIDEIIELIFDGYNFIGDYDKFSELIEKY
jgi:hypothetical protein